LANKNKHACNLSGVGLLLALCYYSHISFLFVYYNAYILCKHKSRGIYIIKLMKRLPDSSVVYSLCFYVIYQLGSHHFFSHSSSASLWCTSLAIFFAGCAVLFYMCVAD